MLPRRVTLPLIDDPFARLNPSRSTPWVTWGIILACVVVFVYQESRPLVLAQEIMGTYALVPARVTAMLTEGFDVATFASIFTSMFMHSGLPHIVGNMWFLHIFGDNVEDNFGRGRYVLFYLLCGLAAASAQVFISPLSKVPMVGASGAIAGVLAAYLILYPRARASTLLPLLIIFPLVEMPAFVLIILWFGLQFFSGVMSLGSQSGGGVAYWAHIGGFFAGLVLALVFRRNRPMQRRWDPDEA